MVVGLRVPRQPGYPRRLDIAPPITRSLLCSGSFCLSIHGPNGRPLRISVLTRLEYRHRFRLKSSRRPSFSILCSESYTAEGASPFPGFLFHCLILGERIGACLLESHAGHEAFYMQWEHKLTIFRPWLRRQTWSTSFRVTSKSSCPPSPVAIRLQETRNSFQVFETCLYRGSHRVPYHKNFYPTNPQLLACESLVRHHFS
jgi:hypothetical protein